MCSSMEKCKHLPSTTACNWKASTAIFHNLIFFILFFILSYLDWLVSAAFNLFLFFFLLLHWMQVVTPWQQFLLFDFASTLIAVSPLKLRKIFLQHHSTSCKVISKLLEGSVDLQLGAKLSIVPTFLYHCMTSSPSRFFSFFFSICVCAKITTQLRICLCEELWLHQDVKLDWNDEGCSYTHQECYVLLLPRPTFQFMVAHEKW